MFIRYFPDRAFRHTNLNRSLQRAFLLCILFFSTLPAFAQENPSSPQIDALLQQRNELIAQSSDTRVTDRELFDLGYRPKAVTHSELMENGSLRVTFRTFLVIPEEKKQRVVERLQNTYTELSSMEINTSAQEVAFLLAPGVSADAIDEIVLHFGYSGHEEH